MQRKHVVPILIFIIAPILILATIISSILYGAKEIHLTTIWNALFHFDTNNVDHTIIFTSRLPRVLGALFVGAFLAISGTLMQGMTRNYLASPSLWGFQMVQPFLLPFRWFFFHTYRPLK